MLADVRCGLVDACAHGPQHDGLQFVRVPAGVGDGIDTFRSQILDASADDLVVAERPGRYVHVAFVQHPAQLLLYRHRQVVVVHQRPGLGEIVQRVHRAAVAALHDLLCDGACSYALRLWLARGAVEAVVLLLGVQHGLGKNDRYMGRSGGHQALHSLCQVLAARTERLCAFGLPLCALGHVVGFGNAAGYVCEDIQFQVVKSSGGPLGVVLDLRRRQQGSTRCLPPSTVTVYPSHRSASHAPS